MGCADIACHSSGRASGGSTSSRKAISDGSCHEACGADAGTHEPLVDSISHTACVIRTFTYPPSSTHHHLHHLNTHLLFSNNNLAPNGRPTTLWITDLVLQARSPSRRHRPNQKHHPASSLALTSRHRHSLPKTLQSRPALQASQYTRSQGPSQGKPTTRTQGKCGIRPARRKVSAMGRGVDEDCQVGGDQEKRREKEICGQDSFRGSGEPSAQVG
jgi:hypothetical protein